MRSVSPFLDIKKQRLVLEGKVTQAEVTMTANKTSTS